MPRPLHLQLVRHDPLEQRDELPIQSGHPCIGCSEAKFWDNGPFYQRLTNFPGFGIEATADKIGLAVAGATVAAVATHAVLTNVRKRKTIGEQPGENDEMLDPERGQPPAGPAKS